MIITHILPCQLPHKVADKFNRESARIYNNVLVNHWRIYRKQGHWLSKYAAEKLEDATGGETFLHAHSRDAAQQAFYKACQTIRGLRRLKHRNANFPNQRKHWRATIWKNTAIQVVAQQLRLSNGFHHAPFFIPLPRHLTGYQPQQFKEVRLVWQSLTQCYQWHIVLNVSPPAPTPRGEETVAIVLGGVYPVVACQPHNTLRLNEPAWHTLPQQAQNYLASYQSWVQGKHRGSRRHQQGEARYLKDLQRLQDCFKDVEHKLSRAVVTWAIEQGAGRLVVGSHARYQQVGQRWLKDYRLRTPPFETQLYYYLKYKAQRCNLMVEWGFVPDSKLTCPWCGKIWPLTTALASCVGCRQVLDSSWLRAKQLLMVAIS